MTQRILRRRAHALALALGCAAIGASPAHAHAPLARGLVLSSDGRAAVRMPGFGLLVRAQADEPFAYACDALLGLQPTDEHAPIVARADGVLLIGTSQGVRIVAADGCPTSTSPAGLAGLAVVQLVTHPSDGQRLYAITADPSPGLYRSIDGGVHWELRTSLAAAQPVSALVVDPVDPDTLHWSASTGATQSVVATSHDAGASFETVEHDRDLVLLKIERSATQQVFALSRDVALRGVSIVRGNSPQGPWESILDLNFFGGFASRLDAHGATQLWVGDEGGSLFHSIDGGDTFEDVHPELATACLADDGDALWACTPGLSTQRAIVRLEGDAASVEDVVALAEVDRMVECGADWDVATICAAAWVEWTVDARMQAPDASPPASSADAGTQPLVDADASAQQPADADADPNAAADAGTQPYAAANGCAAAGSPTQASAWEWLHAVLVACVLGGRARARRARRVSSARIECKADGRA